MKYLLSWRRHRGTSVLINWDESHTLHWQLLWEKMLEWNNLGMRVKGSLMYSYGSQDCAVAVPVVSVVLSTSQGYLFLKKCGKSGKDIRSYLCTCIECHIFLPSKCRVH